MFLFVVLDTKGCGRVLGVFTERRRAEEIRRQYPHYYHLHPAGLLSEVPLPGSGGESAPPEGATPKLVHVAVNTMGHYQLVGVLAERSAAQHLVRKSPAYYRVVACPVDRINPEVLDWTDDAEQRAFLAALIESEPPAGTKWATQAVGFRGPGSGDDAVQPRASGEGSEPEALARELDVVVGTIEQTLVDILSVDRTPPTPQLMERAGRLRQRLLQEVRELHHLAGLVEEERDRDDSGTFWVADGEQFLIAVREIHRITGQVESLLLEMERLSTTTQQTPDVYRLRDEVQGLIAEMLALRPWVR